MSCYLVLNLVYWIQNRKTSGRPSQYLPHLINPPQSPLEPLSSSLPPPPPRNPPSPPNPPQSAHQKPNAGRITNPILGPKTRLINLRPNNPHQLRARIRDADR
jgi:hypothetical protein